MRVILRKIIHMWKAEGGRGCMALSKVRRPAKQSEVSMTVRFPAYGGSWL